MFKVKVKFKLDPININSVHMDGGSFCPRTSYIFQKLHLAPSSAALHFHPPRAERFNLQVSQSQEEPKDADAKVILQPPLVCLRFR